jgi:Tol biopolymer transport system component
MNSDGSNATQLTNAVSGDVFPNWSPDGRTIIYGHVPGNGPDRYPDLWTMDLHGKHQTQVTRTPLWESEPDWGTAQPVR